MLQVNDYFRSTPSWARDGVEDRYEAALAQFGLEPGRNPESRCPFGRHGESEARSVVVYDRGVTCFSMHGAVSRAQLAKMAELPATSAVLSLADLARREVGRFVPEDQLRSLLEHAIGKRLGWAEKQLTVSIDCLFAWARRVNAAGKDWEARLNVIFNGMYPRRSFEFWADGRIVHQEHDDESELAALGRGGLNSFEVRLLAPREKPGAALAVQIAPALSALAPQKDGSFKALKSAWTDRFLAGQRDAVARSSLVAMECIDRPVPGFEPGWRIPRNSSELPRFVHVPQPRIAFEDARGVVDDLFADMRSTFAFDDDEAFARCVAYLIQPMLQVLMPGQFPGYGFSGPTKSGKSFFAIPFPREIYRHNAGDAVFDARSVESDYESAVQLDAHQGVAYAVLDEAIDLTPKQLKMLDSLITSEHLTSRRFGVGYLRRRNYLTVAITAVAKSLPPETAGRILTIHFTESRPVPIEKFFLRWRGKGPLILRGLFDRVSGVPDLASGDLVPDRRPGFGVLKRVLREAFALTAQFDIETDASEILDLICLACFQNVGTPRSGGWLRLSFSTLAKFRSDEMSLRTSKETAERMVHTALGYESTRRHPSYMASGYQWENDRYYDIEVRTEKSGTSAKRRSVYVCERVRAGGDDSSGDVNESPATEDNHDVGDLNGPTGVTPDVDPDTGAVSFALNDVDRVLDEDKGDGDG